MVSTWTVAVHSLSLLTVEQRRSPVHLPRVYLNHSSVNNEGPVHGDHHPLLYYCCKNYRSSPTRYKDMEFLMLIDIEV